MLTSLVLPGSSTSTNMREKIRQKSGKKNKNEKILTRKELSNVCCLHHDLSYKSSNAYNIQINVIISRITLKLK